MKLHFDMAGVRFQAFGHFLEHFLEGFNRDFAFVNIENFHKARHVCAFEIVRQIDVHVEVGDGVLLADRAVTYTHRVTDILDTNFINRYPPGIGAVLYVSNGVLIVMCHVGGFHL